jgi:CheY-like chemotaxis protein
MPENFEIQEFFHILRRDLNHLYDPAHLRRSPLVEFFGLKNDVDAAYRLQQLLVQAIEELNTPHSRSPHPINPNTYPILKNRYVLQASQMEVAGQLCMSDRQLRREQSMAVEYLATRLYKKYVQSSSAPNRPALENKSPADDLAWIKSDPKESVCDPNFVLVTVVDLIEPLLMQKNVTLDLDIEGPLPLLNVHVTAFQQTLLSILNLAVQASEGGCLALTAMQKGDAVDITISYPARSAGAHLLEQEVEVQAVANSLLNFFGAKGFFYPGERSCYSLSLPVFQRTRVLVIDDNPDFFQLMQRYTTGTSYEILGIKTHENLTEQILAHNPSLIILDIMMPGVDGWELLRQIRANSATQNIPVIISTILPQENLAIALGASDFLQKPITQDSLRAVLERWAPSQA